MIEPSMISLGESDDEFARSLVARVYPHACLCYPLGIHQGDQLEEEVRLRFKQVGRLGLYCSFKLLGVLSGNAIPCLSFTPMH